MLRIRHVVAVLAAVLCLTLLVLKTEGASIRHKRLSGKYPWARYQLGRDRAALAADSSEEISRFNEKPDLQKPVATRSSVQHDEYEQNPFFSEW